jgi:hypothetical protein
MATLGHSVQIHNAHSPMKLPERPAKPFGGGFEPAMARMEARRTWLARTRLV